MTRHRLSSSDVVQYRSSPVLDEDLDDLARRYHVPLRLLRSMNTGRYDEQSPRLAVIERMTIRLPVPAQAHDVEWDDQPATGSTLAQFCAAKNADPLRATMEPLTPRDVWLHVLNAGFRRDHVEREVASQRGSDTHSVEPHWVARNLDRDPGGIQLIPGSVVQVPYPLRAHVRPVDVAANPGPADGCSSTCQVMPTWVWTLVNLHIVPLRRDAGELQAMNVGANTLTLDCMAACAPLLIMRNLFTYFREVEPTFSLPIVASGISMTIESAQQHLVDRALQNLYPAVVAERSTLAGELLQKLEDPEFERLAAQALTEPDMIVPIGAAEGSLRGFLCGAIADAYMQLAFVPAYQERVRQDIDALLARIPAGGTGRPALQRASTAAATAMSVARLDGDDARALSAQGPPSTEASPGWLQWGAAMNAMLSSTVGNLPGPPSLAVALAQVRLASELEFLVRVPGGAARAAEPLYRSVLESMIRVGNMNEVVYQNGGTMAGGLVSALRNAQNPSALGPYAERYASRFEAGRGWCSVALVLALLGLIANLNRASDPATPLNLTYFANLTGNTATLGAAVLGVMGRLHGGYGAQWAGRLGRFAATIAILTNTIRVWDAVLSGNTTEIRDGSLQLGASIGVLVPIPLVQIGSIAIILSDAVNALVQLYSEARRPKTHRMFMALAESFRRSPEVRRLFEYGRRQMPDGSADAATDLDRNLRQLQDAIAAVSVDIDLPGRMMGEAHRFPRLHAQHRSRLGALGFADSMINALVE
jgi:hypothetical protein